jgi:hypothetical protein
MRNKRILQLEDNLNSVISRITELELLFQAAKSPEGIENIRRELFIEKEMKHILVISINRLSRPILTRIKRFFNWNSY